MIRAAGDSHPGLQRDQNEDRLLIDPARGLYAVIDGVGGHAGGERASAIAFDLLSTRLSRETGSPAERLREGIALANNAILDEARRDPSLDGMTCVLTAALVSGHDVTIGHVGDTRLYKLRHGRIEKITRDHSPVGEREDAGEISEAEAMHHPRRNEVYRDVGAQPHAPDDAGFIDIVESTLEADAALVLCSDGLSDQVSSLSIRRIVESHAGDPAASVAELIRAANDAGGKDNVTVIVVEGGAFGRGAPRAAAATTTAAPAPKVPSLARSALLLCLGVVLGLALALAAAWFLRPDLLRPLPQPNLAPASDAQRTWRVGLDAGADAASIGDALAQARAGDVIRLAPGDYREAITIDRAVTLIGEPGAVIRAPLGTVAPWTAIAVTADVEVELLALDIAGADGQPVTTGIAVGAGSLRMIGVAISGATDNAIAIAAGARADIQGVTVRDNPGAGIRIAHGADVRVSHSAVMRNGSGSRPARAGIVFEAGASATLVGNAIGDNGGGAIAGADTAALVAIAHDNVLHPAPRLQPRRPAPSTAARTPSPQAPR